MAYRVEGKDIVIDGFNQGIADTPYDGIGDMRNVEIISYPKEASVPFSMSSVTLPPIITGVAYTAQNTGDTITVASTSALGLVPGTAIFFVSTSATGISINKVYYVGNITATTFQLWLMPSMNSTAVAITGDGSGTFTSYQYGNQRGLSGTAYAPVSYFRKNIFQETSDAMSNGTLVTDFSNYLWFLPLSANSTAAGTVPANTPVFLGNIGGIGADSNAVTGVVTWQGYIILIGNGNIDVAPITTLYFTSGPAAAWSYGWKTSVGFGNSNVNGRGPILVSQEDDNVYWGTNIGLYSLIETPGATFDPTSSITYTLNAPAIPIPQTERITALCELGANLLIGTTGQFLYSWDKLSLGFNQLLNMPDPYVSLLVATSTNAYAFSGNRGRIYITNGYSMDLYKKIPDSITGLFTPYFRWRSGYASKNQLHFSFTASTNSLVASDTVAGTWAIDLKTDALRMVNKLTNSGYAGTTAMISAIPSGTQISQPLGNGLLVGWTSSGVYGIDIPSGDPYTNYETYIETDIIPIGTYLKPFTPSQFEWKTSAPLVSGEGVKISYRPNLTASYVSIGETTTVGAISTMYQANFEKVQWAQFKIETKSTVTTSSYTRLTEMRLRDFPSTK